MATKKALLQFPPPIDDDSAIPPCGQAYLEWLDSLLTLSQVKAQLAPEALARLEREARGARAELLGPRGFAASSRLTHRKRDSIDALL